MAMEPTADGKQGENGENRLKILNLFLGNVVICLLAFAAFIHNPIESQYMYRRISKDVFQNVSGVNETLNYQVCYVNKSSRGYLLQEEAQKVTAKQMMYFSLANNIPGMISCILLGAYSDYIGRKFLYIVPLIGHCFRNVILTILIYWEMNIDMYFLGQGVDGMMGGYNAVLMASFAYTADNTPPKNSRTIGLAMLDTSVSIAAGVSSFGAGYFIENTGFFYPSLTASIINFVTIVFVACVLPETLTKERKKDKKCITPIEGVKNVFKVYTNKTGGRRRLMFWLVVIVFLLEILCDIADFSVSYLYELNEPFCWTPTKIGYFDTAGTVLRQILGVPFIKLMQLCCIDEIIAMFGMVAVTAAEIVRGFAYTDWMLYLVPIIGAIGFGVNPILRSIMSKMTPAESQGSLFASLASIRTACYVISAPLFNNIYQLTVDVYRGATYFTMAGLHLLGIALFVKVIRLSKTKLYEKNEGDAETQHID